MTDLKAAAEAAKAATAAYIADPTDRETGRQWDRACAEFSLACTEDAILDLIRERGEALGRERQTFKDAAAINVENDAIRRERNEAQGFAQTEARLVLQERARAEAAEASLASYKEEVERLRAELRHADTDLIVLSCHIADAAEEDPVWQRHLEMVKERIGKVSEALTKEPPHAE